MNSSSSLLLDLKRETLCAILEFQRLHLIELTETIEKHKKELENSLGILNAYRLKEKKK